MIEPEENPKSILMKDSLIIEIFSGKKRKGKHRPMPEDFPQAKEK